MSEREQYNLIFPKQTISLLQSKKSRLLVWSVTNPVHFVGLQQQLRMTNSSAATIYHDHCSLLVQGAWFYKSRKSCTDSAESMQRFWQELTFTLGQIGTREFFVLSLCMMSVYLYLKASSWTLILTLITPLLMVSFFVARHLTVGLFWCCEILGAGAKTSRSVGRTYQTFRINSKGKFICYIFFLSPQAAIPNKQFSVKRRTITWLGLRTNIRITEAIPRM